MLKYTKIAAAVFAASSVVPFAHADSTLVYELTDAEGKKIQHTISVSGRWLRLESEPKGKADYTVMDTGRLLMFEVDDQAKSYQVTRMGRLYWPEVPVEMPRFKPVRQKQAVSGVRCQAVHEMGKDNQPIADHCMSAGGPLGLSAREMITLSRLFMSARRIGLGWLGVATPDERQVSLLSQNPDGGKQEFKSVVHRRVAKDLVRIPREYQRLKPDLPVKKDKMAAREPAAATAQEQAGAATKPGAGEPKSAE